LLRLDDRCLPSGGYAQINLDSDLPGLARVTDALMANPWGIAHSPTGPFWFAENGSGVSDILDGRGQPFALVATFPDMGNSRGAPTGTVFNGGPGFVVSENGVSAPSRFLFASEDGTIAGWTSVVDPFHALLAVDNSAEGAVYKGLALDTDANGQQLLYAADFHGNRIDVFDGNFRPIMRAGSFHDPALPDGYAPFNIENINGTLFVTYAKQDAERRDTADGLGLGFIDAYDPDGALERRFASGGALNSPWGLALAPSDFGPFGGALLVGNTGDGHINAYDPTSGTFLGQLADDHGPITIPNLWSLTFGNGHLAGAADTLFFTAGLADEAHGLFGAIQAPHREGADTGGSGTFDPHAPGEPGDYPLPPRGGITFEEQIVDSQFTTAVMLPLRESSLILIPTLSASSSGGIRQVVGRIDLANPVTQDILVGESHNADPIRVSHREGGFDQGTGSDQDLTEFRGPDTVDLPQVYDLGSLDQMALGETGIAVSLIDDRMARPNGQQNVDSRPSSASAYRTIACAHFPSFFEQTCKRAPTIELAKINDHRCQADVLDNLLPAFSLTIIYLIWRTPNTPPVRRTTT
jgi:uncharacterized protein (TIGR03118 family)